MGYRTPTPEEIEQMERITALSEQARDLIADLTRLPMAPPAGHGEALPEGMERRPISVDRRWLHISQTHLQQGLMAMRRSIMQGEEF